MFYFFLDYTKAKNSKGVSITYHISDILLQCVFFNSSCVPSFYYSVAYRFWLSSLHCSHFSLSQHSLMIRVGMSNGQCWFFGLGNYEEVVKAIAFKQLRLRIELLGGYSTSTDG